MTSSNSLPKNWCSCPNWWRANRRAKQQRGLERRASRQHDGPIRRGSTMTSQTLSKDLHQENHLLRRRLEDYVALAHRNEAKLRRFQSHELRLIGLNSMLEVIQEILYPDPSVFSWDTAPPPPPATSSTCCSRARCFRRSDRTRSNSTGRCSPLSTARPIASPCCRWCATAARSAASTSAATAWSATSKGSAPISWNTSPRWWRSASRTPATSSASKDRASPTPSPPSTTAASSINATRKKWSARAARAFP